jgi:hypothetical protein
MSVAMEAEVPAGLQAGATFQVQTASGIITLTVPQDHQPGQKIPFQVVQPQVVVQVVDPRTQPDDAPILQYCFIGGAYLVGGFSSWIGACVNLCCRPPPTEREAEAAWYTNVVALINLVHLAILILCMIISFSSTEMWWAMLIGVHGNLFCMVVTNGALLVMQVLNDQKVEKRQKAQRASTGAGPATVVGTPVQAEPEGKI